MRWVIDNLIGFFSLFVVEIMYIWIALLGVCCGFSLGNYICFINNAILMLNYLVTDFQVAAKNPITPGWESKRLSVQLCSWLCFNYFLILVLLTFFCRLCNALKSTHLIIKRIVRCTCYFVFQMKVVAN